MSCNNYELPLVNIKVSNPLPAKLFELWRRLLKQIFIDNDLKVFSPKLEAYAFEVYMLNAIALKTIGCFKVPRYNYQ